MVVFASQKILDWKVANLLSLANEVYSKTGTSITLSGLILRIGDQPGCNSKLPTRHIPIDRFNLRMVRLELVPGDLIVRGSIRFNPTMLRLELR